MILKKISPLLAIFFVVILAVFIANTFHEEYPDEYDSIVGGLYITEGKLPYRDWFQHHQPLAYLTAAAILPISGRSFVHFRIFWALALFLLHLFVYLLLRRHFRQKDTRFYLVYLLLVAVGSTYFWGQMLLADTLAAYLLIPAYLFLLVSSFHSYRFDLKKLAIVSIFTFLVWLTSASFSFLALGFYLYALYLYLTTSVTKTDRLKNIIRAALVLAAPYFLLAVYLLLTASAKDWFFANVTYNQYYIYNYPRIEGAPINPIRYAVSIAYNFFGNFFPLLTGVSNFDLTHPLNLTLALSGVFMIIAAVIKQKFILALFLVYALIYANPRSNPFGIHETDYQAAVYILISLVNGVFALYALKELLDTKKTAVSAKFISAVLLLTLGVYWFFSSQSLFLSFSQKVYSKYMGQSPLVYDWPEVTPLVNQIVRPDEYAWIGPFEFKELFYLNAKTPSRYHWFLDHAAKIDKIKSEIIGDFNANRPLVIVFKRHFAPWGGDAASYNYFFTDFLDRNYFRIFELNQDLDSYQYQWQISNPRNFDIDGDFNFDKNQQQEILDRLVAANLIKQVPK